MEKTLKDLIKVVGERYKNVEFDEKVVLELLKMRKQGRLTFEKAVLLIYFVEHFGIDVKLYRKALERTNY